MNENTVQKYDWGYIVNWASHETYAGKILVFDKIHSKTDFYMSKNVQKSFFINQGNFTIRWIDTKNGDFLEKNLQEGETFNVAPMMPIQICNKNHYGSISQVSNGDDNIDRITILKADTIG